MCPFFSISCKGLIPSMFNYIVTCITTDICVHVVHWTNMVLQYLNRLKYNYDWSSSECHIIALIVLALMPMLLPAVHGAWV